MEKILELLVQNLDNIALAVVTLVGLIFFKGNADKQDAIASIKTGIMKLFRENPRFKEIISDGKITNDEWKEVFAMVMPEATKVATKGGAAVLTRWLQKDSVAYKYIEAVARELADSLSAKAKDNVNPSI